MDILSYLLGKAEGGGGGGGSSDYGSGIYTTEAATTDGWRVKTGKRYSHFLMFTEDTFSQNVTSTSFPLYMVYADEYGYTAIMSQTASGNISNGWAVNRLASEYEARSYANFGDDYIDLRLLGNGAWIRPAPEFTYKWIAW